MEKEINLIDPIKIEKSSIEDLSSMYFSIEEQSHLLKGMILLEIRKRLNSDIEFGNFRFKNFLNLTNAQASTLMNLARFFKNHSMKGIGISVGYIISAPQNSEYAEELYEYLIKEEKVTIKKCKDRLKQLKPNKKPISKQNKEKINSEKIKQKKENFERRLIKEEKNRQRYQYLKILGIQEPMKKIESDSLKGLCKYLLQKHHPDKGGNSERFIQIKQACEGLK